MNKVKVLYSAYYGSDCYPFDELGETVVQANGPDDMTEKDAILFVWGGSDISPTLYGHPQSKTTYPAPLRDAAEWACMRKAVELGIPIIGICRGGQMLCALAGGFLIQDTRGHTGRGHFVDTHDGQTIRVNSLHHQMMAGYENLEHELLAWSSENHSPHYTYKNDLVYPTKEGFVEPEFIYFPKVKGYAIQWHPEMMQRNEAATQFILKEFYERTTNISTVEG